MSASSTVAVPDHQGDFAGESVLVDDKCDEFTLHMNLSEYVRLVCRHAQKYDRRHQLTPSDEIRPRTNTLDSLV